MHSHRTRLHRGRQSVLFIPVDQIRRKNVCSDRKSRRNRDDERDDLSIRPDGRERVRAAEISGDSGIRRVEELPNIFAALQTDYPGIDYEMLLGDYDEVECWLGEGRVDCGFLRLPTLPRFDVIPLSRDEYKVVMPCGHPLAENSAVAIEALEGLPFLLLEHGGRTEVSDLLERSGVHPDVRFTTWEDFAIMAMAERGLGVGILPDIILRRIPYKLEIRPLSIPYYRSIGLAVKDQAHLTPAVTKFIEYLPFREEAQPTLL